MVQQKSSSTQKTIVSGEERLIENLNENKSENSDKNIPIEYIFEFISRHHLNRLWDEFVYEKENPKIELSAYEVLAMINLPPEEQERILQNHE